ncbi:hypothetical protein ONZ45_g3717 [Pleurotus djamor]|nr:hypothetical protein ONZ45_g3717 [Pleurotus djamor]
MQITPQKIISNPLQREFDIKIDASLASFRRLCEQRNYACSVTKKLPMEILAMIFHILAESPGPRYCNYRRWEKWLPATYVCRQWRNAALSEPSLWCDLTELGDPWVERFFNRSGVLPLKVDHIVPGEETPYSSDLPSDFTENILKMPLRLGQLVIKRCTDQLAAHLDKPTPHLTSLTMNGMVNNPFRIPSGFLDGSAPRLGSVSISSGWILPMPTASWLFKIRNLTLSSNWGFASPTDGQAPMTIRSFLEFLKPLEVLETLHVSFNMDAPFRDYEPKMTQFPLLRSLQVSFTERNIRMMNLFKYVEAPSLKTLEIDWPTTIDTRSRMITMRKFFVMNTKAKLKRLEWSGYSGKAKVVLSSPKAQHTLTFHSVPVALDYIPFHDLDTITTLEIGIPEHLQVLDSVPDPLPYPSLKLVIFQSPTLLPKAKHIPVAKRWLKTRVGPGLVERMAIIGVQTLTDKDIAGFKKTLPVQWVKIDREWY